MGPGLSADWVFEERMGPVDSLFDAASWAGVTVPTVRVLKVSTPTIVLGSSQSFEVLDLSACVEAGVDVVRRRSGGGAVWLDEDMVWVDVFVPAGHPRWDADIGRAMWWLGEAWAEGLTSVGVVGEVGAEVHRGALVRTEWSSLVCFAGLGPGEVTIGGRKAVGISQRRTRAGALFQCGIVRRWDPVKLVGFLRLDDASARPRLQSETAGSGYGLGADADRALGELRALLSESAGN